MKWEVIFNIPNLIGYLRLVLLLIGMYQNKALFVLLYGMSAILDAFDGYFARLYNQSTVMGACLDMFTDRLSTVIIIIRIARENKSSYKFISLYVFTDLLSHMIHFHTSLLCKLNHKIPSNYFMQLYYYKPVLFSLCLTSELYFMCSLYEIRKHSLYNLLYHCTVVKMIFHIIQLVTAVSKLSEF